MAIPDPMNDLLNRKYAVISDPFAGLKPGETRNFGSFTARQAGPVTVVAGHGSPLGDMQLLRTQGYTPEQATQAVVGSSAAGLDNTRSTLLPAESAASVAKTRADTGLINQQAKFFPMITLADVAKTRADTGLTGAQADLTRRNIPPLISTSPDALFDVERMGTYGYSTPGYGSPYLGGTALGWLGIRP